MTYHWICNNSNTTGAISGAGTAYPSEAHEFIHGLMGFVSLNLKFSVLCYVFLPHFFWSLY